MDRRRLVVGADRTAAPACRRPNAGRPLFHRVANDFLREGVLRVKFPGQVFEIEPLREDGAIKQGYMKIVKTFFAALLILLGSSRPASANNLALSSGLLAAQDTVSHTIKVQFDISWDNSWRDAVNYDAAWVFIKYSKDSGISWAHATLKTAGVNPSGGAQGTGTALDIIVPADCKGAFLRRTENGSGPVTATGVKLVWDWNADGLTVADRVRIRVFAVEMVYVPAGAFYAGDYATATAALKKGSADTDPWQITSESAIAVTNAANGSSS